MFPDSIKAPAAETPEAPAENQEAPIEGNQPSETPEIEATEPTTENGTEIEGGSGEEAAPQEPTDAQKSEEKPPEPPKTLRIGDHEIPVEQVLEAYKNQETTRQHLDIADKALKFIAEAPRDAFLNVFAGKLGSKDKAREEWNRICEEQVIENWKRANEPEEARRKRELDEREAQIKEQEKNALSRQKAAEAEKVKALIVPKIQNALKANGLDTEDPGLIGLVAEVMAKAADDGGFLTAEDAVPLALDRLDGLLSVRLKSQPKEWLLGHRPDLKGEIIKESIQAVKGAKAEAKTAPQKAEPKPSKPKVKSVSQAEFRNMFH